MEKSKTIVAFHIGKGGNFNNPGHLSFIGKSDISNFLTELNSGWENQYEIFGKVKGKENLTALYYNAVDGDEDALAKFEAIGLGFGAKGYLFGDGFLITEDEVDSGIGKIELDSHYDTTYTCYLEDCGEEEIRAINDSDNYDREACLAEIALMAN